MSSPYDNLPPDKEPLFNIGAVTRMTGIPEATLRIWERRYDFPTSSRTTGGHRLYSPQEVTRLRWVKQRIGEGMQISQAIQALQHQEREGDPAVTASPLEQAIAGDSTAVSTEFVKRQLVEALLRHDTAQADQVLAEAYTIFPLENLVLDVIGPALHDIGEEWHEGHVNVATEHLGTHYLRTRLLMWMRTGPPAYRVSPVVLACAPGELHEGSLLMIGVLLRRLRWPIVYLGQTMPINELPDFVNEVNPGVLVFVAMLEGPARALAKWPRWLPEAASSNRPVVTYGGRIFTENPELADQVPGVLLGRTVREGIETLNRIMHELNPFAQ